MVRVGLFGGTFNPMHIGHIQIARKAQQIALLDVVYCIPTNIAPHKNDDIIAPFIERCSLAKKKLTMEYRIVLSTVETELPIPSYTFRTLQYFSRIFPYSELFFICGSLDFLSIHSWDNGVYILKKYNYIIAPRNSVDFTDVKDYLEQHTTITKIEECSESIVLSSHTATYIYLSIPLIPISSTEVRSVAIRERNTHERTNTI